MLKSVHKSKDEQSQLGTINGQSLYLQGVEHYIGGRFKEALGFFNGAAQENYHAALLFLERIHTYGLGLTKDKEKGKQCFQLAEQHRAWFEALAQSNSNLAYEQCAVGLFYDYIDKNHRKAVEFYQSAADQGCAIAQSKLGKAHMDGLGVDKDETKGIKFYKQAADKGYCLAQTNLGEVYEIGLGVARDETKAMEYYKLAADQGDPVAQHNLWRIYKHGKGVAKDDEMAIYYLSLAAEQGYAPSLFQLGKAYMEGQGIAQDADMALLCFKLAANQGDARGQFGVGLAYLYGDGVTQNVKMAVVYFKSAAKQGEVNAQFWLGLIYKNLVQDEEMAINYFKSAGGKGHPQALCFLGKIYLEGSETIVPDQKAAKAFFALAAERGDAEAQFNLGKIYQDDNDEQAAMNFYRQASHQRLDAQEILCEWFLQGKYPELEKHFHALANTNELFPTILCKLGNFHNYAGKKEEAELYFYKASLKSNSEAHLELGILYLERIDKKNQESIRLPLYNFIKVIDCNPEDKHLEARAWYQLAKICMKITAEALKNIYNEGISCSFTLKNIVNVANGDRVASAIFCLRKAVEISPDDSFKKELHEFHFNIYTRQFMSQNNLKNLGFFNQKLLNKSDNEDEFGLNVMPNKVNTFV